MLTNKDYKRRNSDPAAGNAHLDIAAPRQTGKTATELCSFAIVWWSFVGLLRFFKVDGTWGPEGGVSRRMVKKNLAWQITYVKTNSIFFFSRLTSLTSCGLRLSTHLSCFCTSFFLICGFSLQVTRERLKQNITKKSMHHHFRRGLPWFKSETPLHCWIWLIDTAWQSSFWYVPSELFNNK